jgi:hypothetical protein
MQFHTWKAVFFPLFNPFCMSKLKRGKKPGRKRREYRKRPKNGRKNGGKMERREGGFTVVLFSALFRSIFCRFLPSFAVGTGIFALFSPFYMSKLKRVKKPGEKRWEYKKGPKNSRKNGRKKGYCERPYYFIYVTIAHRY